MLHLGQTSLLIFLFLFGRPMRDFDDVDFLMESWNLTEKRKRKKGSKKDKKGLKLKKNVNMKTQECIQKKKKKKKTKFKEAMDDRKEKKKEKKKNKVASDLQDSVMFTQKPKASKPPLNQRLDHVMPDSMKSTKRKKKVMLDSLPRSIHVKRLRFVSLTPRGEEDPVTVSDSCSQVTAGHDNGSQCTSDDINSQDLFITQKIFRSSASQPSSEDAKAFAVSPLMQKDKGQIYVAEIEQFYDDKCLQDSRQTKTERRKKISFQTEMESQSTLPEKKGSSPECVGPSEVNAYLDKPVVVNVGEKNTSLQRPPHTELPPSTVSTWTQTENFFTTELSSYLHFCKEIRATVRFQDVKPLDLSLKQTGKTLEEKIAEDQKGEMKVDRDMNPSDLSQVKEVKKGHSSRADSTPSPQSECEHKSANTTNSSEDNELSCRTSKLDMTQVRTEITAS